MRYEARWLGLTALCAGLAVGAAQAEPLDISTAPAATHPGLLTVAHPPEGAQLPWLSEVFAYGSVTAGSTLTVNGNQVSVHRRGGYLTMVPLSPGEQVLRFEARTPDGQTLTVHRRVTVAGLAPALPVEPLAIDAASIQPAADRLLAPGDLVRVAFRGSPGAQAEFTMKDIARHVPMWELASPPVDSTGPAVGRGIYEGHYIIQPGDKAEQAEIQVLLSRGKDDVKEKAPGRILIDTVAVPRMGWVTEDTVAARTGPDGGYDLFLYRGMRVQLTGKAEGHWRARFSSIQSGWVKESAIQELPRGSAPALIQVPNLWVIAGPESTLVRIPLSQTIPYRVEQSLDPLRLTLTLYGAYANTDLIRYDPADPLIRLVRWRQAAPDTVQLLIDPAFTQWWGFDVRYEDGALLVEVRKPWAQKDLRGMVIAIDPGHGGRERGAMGTLGTWEKEGNLAIAKVLKGLLERAGARPFLTREKDTEVPLYDRPRLAWNQNARLFISIHANSAGVTENPVLHNGYSLYWYQPQSFALAQAVHQAYGLHTPLPDHGLYYADLAVCRMTQMPAILTEQAYMIVPEQEQMIFDPKWQRQFAQSILTGIRNFLQPKQR